MKNQNGLQWMKSLHTEKQCQRENKIDVLTGWTGIWVQSVVIVALFDGNTCFTSFKYSLNVCLIPFLSGREIFISFSMECFRLLYRMNFYRIMNFSGSSCRLYFPLQRYCGEGTPSTAMQVCSLMAWWTWQQLSAISGRRKLGISSTPLPFTCLIPLFPQSPGCTQNSDPDKKVDKGFKIREKKKSK